MHWWIFPRYHKVYHLPTLPAVSIQAGSSWLSYLRPVNSCWGLPIWKRVPRPRKSKAYGKINRQTQAAVIYVKLISCHDNDNQVRNHGILGSHCGLASCDLYCGLASCDHYCGPVMEIIGQLLRQVLSIRPQWTFVDANAYTGTGNCREIS